jgi:hypothetical protein
MSAHDAAAAQMEEGHGGLYGFGPGRTRFVRAVDRGLADATARHGQKI